MGPSGPSNDREFKNLSMLKLLGLAAAAEGQATVSRIATQVATLRQQAIEACDNSPALQRLVSVGQKHLSVNKFIVGFFLPLIAYHARRASILKPVGAKRLTVMAVALLAQHYFPRLSHELNLTRVLADHPGLARWVPTSELRRQNLLMLSIWSKACLTAYTFKLISRKLFTSAPPLLKLPLQIAAVVGMTLVNRTCYEAEKDLISRTLTVQETQRQRVLEDHRAHLAGELINYVGSDSVAIMDLIHTENFPFIFTGFGQSLALEEGANIAMFARRLATLVQRETSHPLAHVTSPWVKAEDYARCKAHFDSFTERYETADELEKPIFETFAKIYPFSTPAGDLQSMIAFIQNHNQRTLQRSYPELASGIEHIFTGNMLAKILQTELNITLLCGLISELQTELTLSLQSGALTPKYIAHSQLLRQIIRPLQIRTPLLEALDRAINYTSAAQLAPTLQRLSRSWLDELHQNAQVTQDTLELCQAPVLAPSAPDTQIENNLAITEQTLNIAERIHALTPATPYLYNAKEQIEGRYRTSFEQCRQTTKKVVSYTMGAALFVGYCAFPAARAFLPMPALGAAAAGGIYVARDRVAQWIQAQIRQASDEGRGSVERAIETGVARVRALADEYSPATIVAGMKRRARRQAQSLWNKAVSLVTPSLD